MAEIVYGLCAVLSIACAALLVRGYRRGRSRLLMWSALCFVGLAANNVLLFADNVLFPAIDLSLWRSAAAMCAMLVLVLGLIWEAT